MRTGIFATPRPEPRRLVPALGGAVIVLLALPVFLLADWRVAGWALGALLWIGVLALDLVLARLRSQADSLATAGVQAFGLFFKATALLVVLIAAAASDARLALAAALTFGLAYTFSFGLSLFAYFGGSR